MHKDLADRIGMAFFYAGKSPNELLAYWGGDRRDSNFRRALGVYEQVKRRSDGSETVVDSAVARMRADSDGQNYAIDKIAENLAELKRKADKVFGRIADSEEPGECGLEEPGKVP